MRMTRACPSRAGAIEAQSTAGVVSPASICNDECARSGGAPEGPGLQGAHRFVAALGQGSTLTFGLRLALHPLQTRRAGHSHDGSP